MYIGVLPAYMPMHRVCLMSKEARRLTGAMELELQMVMRCHNGARN